MILTHNVFIGETHSINLTGNLDISSLKGGQYGLKFGNIGCIE